MVRFRKTGVRPQRLLQAFALVTVAIMDGSSSSAITKDKLAGVTADLGPGGTAPVRPFRLDQVQLGDGLLQEKRDRIKGFLRDYDERRFIVLFNNQAGRSNPPDVSPPGGWEDGGLLSGHWAGHFMTALSQAYADQGEEIFKTKLDWMVTELAACQDAITARMLPGGDSPDREQLDATQVGRVIGKFGSALRLDDSSQAQYVELPQETINQLREFTIATWVNLTTTQTWSRLFDFGHDTTINMFLTPRADTSDYAPRFAITTGGSGQEQQINGNSALPTGQWVHIAVTLAGNAGTLYVDGQVSGSNTAMTLDPSKLNNPGNRWIGRSQYSGDAFLNATIDEFHIFNRALSAAEIQSMLTSPAGSTSGGNIAWYRFDEEGGTSLKDSSANGRDAGIVGNGAGPGVADWIPTHPHYLGALPEDTVLRLGPPRWAVYGSDPATNTWAPWYTQHKIMRGLLDAYYNTNNSQALKVVVKMADWAYLALTIGDKNHPDYTGNLTRDNLNYMWDLYIGGEFGGANEVFPEIYELTGDARHLETAKAFDNRESLFAAAVEDRDILVVTSENKPGRRRQERLHANTHVPQFIGYLRVYEQTREQEYFMAAKNFYGWMVPHRQFSSGGSGGNYPGSSNNAELFQNRDNVAHAIAQDGAETCTTYNLLKLARNLFLHEHNASYMDGYERGLFNMIAGSRADTYSDNDPQLTYFQPLTPGAHRDYGNTGTCCGGTGMESHTKYQETVYLRSADGSALWVNLYVPSTLTWAEKGFTVRQETAFPRGDTARFSITGQGALDLKLRIPAWVNLQDFRVAVNGGEQMGETAQVQPSSYLTLSRVWNTGDVVEVRMPFRLRIERARDRPDVQSMMWGPVLLQILGDPSDGSGNASSYWALSLYRHLKRDGDYSLAAVTRTGSTPAGDPLFAAGHRNLTARPYYISDTQAVSSYFQRLERTVVFGGIDTGVPNRKHNDGLPNYDVPVAGILSPGTDGLTFLDLVWDQAPFATHAAFVGVVASTTQMFVAAGLYTTTERDVIVAKASEAEQELAPQNACCSR